MPGAYAGLIAHERRLPRFERTIDIYLSGLLAVILVDWKHAWQIEADEYESD